MNLATLNKTDLVLSLSSVTQLDRISFAPSLSFLSTPRDTLFICVLALFHVCLWMNYLFRSTRLTIFTSKSIFQFSRTFASIPASSRMESLKVHNSLAPGQVVQFEPIQKGKVSWYACGPTVYDKSHLGHARNYVSTDIIRRIMLHYFKADVNFVMNITDIDDKVPPTSTVRP